MRDDMSTTKLCKHPREIDGARCVLNKHPDNPDHHAFAYRVDFRPLFEEAQERINAAAELHRRTHSCGGEFYTMSPAPARTLVTIGPCPTLRALGVTE